MKTDDRLTKLPYLDGIDCQKDHIGFYDRLLNPIWNYKHWNCIFDVNKEIFTHIEYGFIKFGVCFCM